MEKHAKQAVILCLLLLAVGCTRKGEGPSPKPSRLFKPTFSYWSFEKTKDKLDLKNWEVLEDRRPLASDERPRFQMLQIKVSGYTDSGFKGDLVLSFYNDRLMKTQFYVADINEYVKAAQTEQNFGLGKDLSGEIAPSTHIWIGKEADGRSYLGMEDRVLTEQMKDWIRQYS